MSPEVYLPARAVMQRFAVSKMTLWRWCYDERYAHLGFPCAVKIGSRNYWKRSELDAWEDSFAKRAA